VFVPDSCYAEFYLHDADGQGHWFPCQVAGPREFGGMSDHRPILQKGDNIRVPDEQKDPQRLPKLTQFCSMGRRKREFHESDYTEKPAGPQVEFVRKLLPAN